MENVDRVPLHRWSLLWLVALVMLLVLRAEDKVRVGKYTQYLFNYEHEFVKRGLPGELLRLLADPITLELVTAISWAAVALLAFLLFTVWLGPCLRSGQRPWLWLGVLALASPATLQHFVYDLGRFDTFLLILMLAALPILPRTHRFTEAMCLLAVSAVSLLVHEAAFFLTLPVLFAYWIHVRQAPAFQAATIALVVLLTALIGVHGELSSIGLGEHLVLLRESQAHPIHEGTVVVLHNAGLKENVLYTLAEGVTWERFLHHVAFFILFYPTLHIIADLFIRLFRSTSRTGRLLLLSAFSPLVLYPLGHDHFRWWAMAITNLFIVFMLLQRHDSVRVSEVVAANVGRYRMLYKVAILLGLFLGPLRFIESFGVVGDLIEASIL